MELTHVLVRFDTHKKRGFGLLESLLCGSVLSSLLVVSVAAAQTSPESSASMPPQPTALLHEDI
jgi:hypothetical protein